MQNSDVIKMFLNKQEAKGSNLYSTGQRLISFNTSIAEWYSENYLIVNHTKYSVTTTKQQGYLRSELIRHPEIIELCLNGVYRNIHDLVDIYESNKRGI